MDRHHPIVTSGVVTPDVPSDSRQENYTEEEERLKLRYALGNNRHVEVFYKKTRTSVYAGIVDGLCSLLKKYLGGCRRSPALMHLGANLAVVNCANRIHGLLRQRRQIGSRAVLRNLLRTLAAGNRARHRIEHQDPLQRELRHARTRREKAANLFHRAESSFVIHARKRFSHIEGFAVPVEVPVVVLFEFRIASQLARQHSTRQRNASQNPNLFLLCLFEEQFSRPLAKAI